MATGTDWTATEVELAGVKLHLARAGSGRPVLVLHHDTGSPERLDFYDVLARRFDVIVPNHPGYGRSERPQWLRGVRDVAVMYQWLLADLGVERPSLVGLGFGGWIAAEMATMAPREFHRLVLVGAMGLKPPEGDILDQAIVSYLDYARAGSGRPVLVLHHDIGSPERLDFYDELSVGFDVIVPHHPGYGRSERPQWLRSVRDVAVIYQCLLADLGIERASLIGLGFGGWIAAEMATMAPDRLHRLVLVGAMGLKPPDGDIFDQAIVSYIDYARAGFHDQSAFARVYGDVTTDQLVAWDICREMCFRIAWKPYMYSQTLPHLLGGVKAPALVVCGDDDRIVPRSAGELYAAALPNARFEIVGDAGHCAEMEQPEALARLIGGFIAEN